jgi:hypothetical protein
MSNKKLNSLNTLDRELSSRVNHPDSNLNIINSKQNHVKSSENISNKQINKSIKLSKIQQSDDMEKKIKYNTVKNFKDFYSYGNKLGQNYNTELENTLRFSESTRQKTSVENKRYESKSQNSNSKTLQRPKLKLAKKKHLPKINEVNESNNHLNIVDIDSNLRIPSVYNFTNEVSDTASRIPKASAEYWDNTKRRNLDTAIYTNNPQKIQGRGFGNISEYDLFFNGVGLPTRQDEPDINPRNVDNDRIYLTNHNYHYDKHHVTENLPCGADTRYLNKKTL